jgi:hypothetical protein
VLLKVFYPFKRMRWDYLFRAKDNGIEYSAVTYHASQVLIEAASIKREVVGLEHQQRDFILRVSVY